MTDYTVIVKGENETASNLFDVIEIIKKYEAKGKQVLVFSSEPMEAQEFKQRVMGIFR